MKISARNQIRGKVTAIKEGAVEAQVTLDIGGGQTMVSVITMDSVANLGLKVGSEAVAIVKADSYDREKGFEWRLMTTHNGYQYTGTQAIDKRTAALLRDALDALLKGN